ncbi:hypothetical protein FVF58_19270 [Paraburkholderia panacisoli]|uniref:Uncharacterized protein n=1 Tax=Paraburkholderia panacisoli TaxID=2603818 RepID=A0A5B0H5W2_9BURK|nr:hypothetical protein [Paraburkholderia panacisoli]KAA1010491.1 hypothetical protein FVF58_19270 [Paraburkholderia panacisoli]
MARPIGIFGVLMALGGFLAVRYVQNKRAAQLPTARELSRWEGEGGAVATPVTPAGTLGAGGASPAAQGANGSAHSNGDGRAWPFPRS